MILNFNPFFQFSTIFIWYACIIIVNGEVFTAIIHMEHVLTLENNLIKHLSRFIDSQEHRLEHLKKRLDEFTIINVKTFKNISKYLSHPSNEFLIIKRMFNDWGITLSNVIDEEVLNKYIFRVENIYNKRRYPKVEDLNGAAIAISRLQQTYKLNAFDLANGQIRGIQYNSTMSASDCYQVGLETFKNKIYHHAAMWLNEARKRLEVNLDESQTSFRVNLLIKLAYSHKKQRDYNEALEVTKKILEIDPNNENATMLENRITAEMNTGKKSYTIIQQHKNQIIENEFKTHENPYEHINPDEHTDYEQLLHEAVCRGEISPAPKKLAPLRCRYLTNKSKFLTIAPLKLEEVSLDPYVVIYHNVISDIEIDVIKSIAKQKLKRAGVDASNGTGAIDFVDYRISKSAWLFDHHHKYVNDISIRVKDMTGMSMDTAEELQVVNYGIGGFYDTHHDYAPVDDTAYDDAGIGNRIGTVLFYMSNVEAGGATAFHLIKKAIFPEKGSAIFWLNLHANGTGDVRTKHAGCPVLVGSKWVSNKWLHQVGQEFLRPCGLHPYHIDSF